MLELVCVILGVVIAVPLVVGRLRSGLVGLLY